MAAADRIMRGLRGEREAPSAVGEKPAPTQPKLDLDIQEVLGAFPWQVLAQNLATREDIDADELSGILGAQGGDDGEEAA
ncbi:hypothetical protein DFP74_2333 [Nocardiopsis sp. Huas11]|uniref:hypothetical protein n=1 Tax=Nocardiopsis sp. Huas11 TaxID=2183912 RepID=UPI000EB2CF8E|nr:hypothetical protein [Nocardiopsis sp. Huas11]RKS06690.1 hypothetical protein DFP74_2333 [Nocardiopsis sp. Huas11]